MAFVWMALLAWRTEELNYKKQLVVFLDNLHLFLIRPHCLSIKYTGRRRYEAENYQWLADWLDEWMDRFIFILQLRSVVRSFIHIIQILENHNDEFESNQSPPRRVESSRMYWAGLIKINRYFHMSLGRWRRKGGRRGSWKPSELPRERDLRSFAKDCSFARAFGDILKVISIKKQLRIICHFHCLLACLSV